MGIIISLLKQIFIGLYILQKPKMMYGNKIGNKIQHNTEGHEDTRLRSCQRRMKICWKSISCVEWLILLLIGFTILAMIFLNGHAYLKGTQEIESLNDHKTTSLGEITHQTTNYKFINNNHWRNHYYTSMSWKKTKTQLYLSL